MKERMWSARVFIATSMDGYIARDGGDLAWLTDPPSIAGHVPPVPNPDVPSYDEHMASVDHIVMGRGTYDKVLTFGFWPFEQHRVIVLSRSLPSMDDRITVARSTDEVLALLDERASASVYVDGGKVIQEWLRLGLIDEIVLTRVPVLLGGGIGLFGSLDNDIQLIYKGTSSTLSGMTTTRYAVLRDAI